MTLPLYWLFAAASDDRDGRGHRPAHNVFNSSHAVTDDSAPNPDADLWARVRAGDEATLEQVVRDHLILLRRVAHRCGYKDAAGEELVQDVFAQLWERRETLQVRTTVRGYLVAMVRNAAVSRIRHEQVAARVSNVLGDEEAAVGLTPFIAPDRALEHAELAAALHNALAALPPRMRQVALLRWHDHLTRREIAALLGTSEATVRNQLHTAVRHLRDRLAKFFG